MKIKNNYQPRFIRFIEVHRHDDWQIKIYSIAIENEIVATKYVEQAKTHLDDWLSKSKITNLETYKVATLIIHEGRAHVFAIVNWWIDENMLQNFVYLKENSSDGFLLFSENGIATCVWEMAIWWHERNAWVKHILKQNENPDWEAYLNEKLNINI